jgi:hypothetical protein
MTEMNPPRPPTRPPHDVAAPHRRPAGWFVACAADQQGELFATLIEVTFEAHDGGTALTMRQSYFEPMPPDEVVAGAEQGWSEQLDKLEQLFAD